MPSLDDILKPIEPRAKFADWRVPRTPIELKMLPPPSTGGLTIAPTSREIAKICQDFFSQYPDSFYVPALFRDRNLLSEAEIERKKWSLEEQKKYGEYRKIVSTVPIMGSAAASVLSILESLAGVFSTALSEEVKARANIAAEYEVTQLRGYPPDWWLMESYGPVGETAIRAGLDWYRLSLDPRLPFGDESAERVAQLNALDGYRAAIAGSGFQDAIRYWYAIAQLNLDDPLVRRSLFFCAGNEIASPLAAFAVAAPLARMVKMSAIDLCAEIYTRASAAWELNPSYWMVQGARPPWRVELPSSIGSYRYPAISNMGVLNLMSLSKAAVDFLTVRAGGKVPAPESGAEVAITGKYTLPGAAPPPPPPAGSPAPVAVPAIVRSTPQLGYQPAVMRATPAPAPAPLPAKPSVASGPLPSPKKADEGSGIGAWVLAVAAGIGAILLMRRKGR